MSMKQFNPFWPPASLPLCRVTEFIFKFGWSVLARRRRCILRPMARLPPNRTYARHSYFPGIICVRFFVSILNSECCVCVAETCACWPNAPANESNVRSVCFECENCGIPIAQCTPRDLFHSAFWNGIFSCLAPTPSYVSSHTFSFAHVHLLGIRETVCGIQTKNGDARDKFPARLLIIVCQMIRETRPLFRLFEYASRVLCVLIYDSHCHRMHLRHFCPFPLAPPKRMQHQTFSGSSLNSFFFSHNPFCSGQ